MTAGKTDSKCGFGGTPDEIPGEGEKAYTTMFSYGCL